ncbi:response regulator [Paenibacillus puldeungensis]
MMVVEDESIVRMGLHYMLDWEAYDVFWKAEASNGEEAWRLLQTQSFDIVMTDIRMPVMDGIELVRRIKEHYADIQIIVISSYNDFPKVQEALRLGVVDYLHKPTMDREEIEASLQRLLERFKAKERPSDQDEWQASRQLRSSLLAAVSGGEEAGKDVQRSLERLGLHRGFRIAIFRTEPSEPSSGVAGKTGPSRFPSVESLIAGYAVHMEGSVLAARNGEELIWLTPAWSGGDLMDLDAWLGDVRRNVMNLLHVPLTCSSSGIYHGPESITQAYDEAVMGLAEQNVSSHQSVRLAKEYVDQNFQRDLSLSECARHVHVSTSYLSRLFAKEIGMNFNDYLNAKRLDHAKGLLRETNRKVHQISEDVGFLNPHYFSKLFKEYTGMTPREFRGL